MTVTATVRPAPKSREERTFDLDIVAAVAATTTFGIGMAKGTFAVKRLEVISPSDYAADPANYYTIDVRPHGGSAALSWSTQSTADGALSANVVAEKDGPVGPLAAGQLDVVCTKAAAAANLPAQTRVRVTIVLL